MTAATLPAALGTTSGAAQTPAATPAAPLPPMETPSDPLGLVSQIVANPAPDLLQRLQSSRLGPSEFLLFGEFTPNPWQDAVTSGLAPGGVGGVLWTRFGGSVDNQADVLGGCVVMADIPGADLAYQNYVNQSSASGRSIVPMQFGALQGFVGVSSDAYADAIGKIGNLVVFAADIFLTDGARTNRNASMLRATNHAVAILNHIETQSRVTDTA